MEDEVTLPNTTTTLNIIHPETLPNAGLIEVVQNSTSPAPTNEWNLHNDTMDENINHSRILIQKDGRYVLSNVFVHMDIVYFVTENENVTISPVLCSTTDIVVAYYLENCKIQIVSPHEFSQIHSTIMDNIHPTQHMVENAVILEGLNPTNPYHIVWEAMIPAVSMLLEDGGMPREPTEALSFLQHQNWSIFFTDMDSLTSPLNLDWWKELLPQVSIIQRGPVYRVRTLIAGTRGRCAHTRHCSNATFVPEDSPWVFRNLIAQTHNLTKTAREKIPGETSICRITLVQRAGSRKIINFDEWTKAIVENDFLGPREIRTVDFGDLSIPEQISVASSTDVFILIHGGALVHISWLPHGAIIVDINPFMHFHTTGWLVNWMRYTLNDLHLGHLRIQVNNSEGQFVDGLPLPSDCVCYEDLCGHRMFGHFTGITLNISSISKQVVEAVNSWRRQEYEEPYSPLEAMPVFQHWQEFRKSEFQKEEEERQALGLPKRPTCFAT